MELLNSIFNFFTDKTKGLSHKAIFILTAILLLVLIDNTLSFSYYYNTQNKIEQINGLTNILTDTTLTNNERQTLKSLKNNLIVRNTWKDEMWKKISEFEFKSEKYENPEIRNKQIGLRSYFWHYVSSGWIFLIIALIMPIVGFMKLKTSIGSTILTLFIIEVILFGLAWIYAMFFSYIPIMFGNPVYNYFLNLILCLLTLLLFSYLGEKNKLQN